MGIIIIINTSKTVFLTYNFFIRHMFLTKDNDDQTFQRNYYIDDNDYILGVYKRHLKLSKIQLMK